MKRPALNELACKCIGLATHRRQSVHQDVGLTGSGVRKRKYQIVATSDLYLPVKVWLHTKRVKKYFPCCHTHLHVLLWVVTTSGASHFLQLPLWLSFPTSRCLMSSIWDIKLFMRKNPNLKESRAFYMTSETPGHRLHTDTFSLGLSPNSGAL